MNINNNTNTKNMFQIKKIKRNITNNNKIYKQRNLISKNNTNKRINKNSNIQAPIPANKETKNYTGNCFMKLDSKYFDLYPIESFDRYLIYLL
jgi:hypothetical protein